MSTFQHLRASQLLNEHDAYSKLKLFPSKDLKLVISGDEIEDKEKVRTLLSEQFKFLKAKRVEKVSHLSIAEWIPSENAAHVTHKTGKLWQSIGIQQANRLLLNVFEALYMVESNNLELLYNNVLMSIEQTRCLVSKGLLNFMDEYRVYAQLRRLGFIVLKHDPKRNLNIEESESHLRDVATDGCEEIKIEFDIMTRNENKKQDQFDNKSISKWKKYKIDIKAETKRKKCEDFKMEDEKSSIKKIKYEGESSILKANETYCDMGDIFKKIQIIKKQDDSCERWHNLADIKFIFDLCQPNSKFKKSVMVSPDYRIIILNTRDKEMPCELCMTRKNLLMQDNVPIIIARVGFDNISYFLYTVLDVPTHT